MTGLGDRFAELVARPEPAIPLDEAALVIAAHAYPGLDIAAQLARLDQLAEGCPEPTLDGLRRHLFDELGFTGNGVRYADARNSFLNCVLDRKVGIPISLALVMMEVGRRIGVVLEGVGMPGHFLVRHLREPPVLVDAFSGGRTLDAEGAEALFRRLHGDGAPFSPDLLTPARPRAILTRMLANLRHLYAYAGDATSTGWVLRLRAAIPPEDINELADLAGVQASLGRFNEAAATLDAIADQLPDSRADRARAQAKLLRSRLN
jgi:regulator of sirC expression with transglutaminase-like and TPR domain